MQDTCGIHVSSEVIKIHARYMRDTCGDQGVAQGRIQARIQAPVGLEIRILECIPYVSDMYRECILCAMYLRVKIHCI